MKAICLTLALVFTSSAFATEYEYECYSYYWNGYDGLSGIMDLKVSPTSAAADIREESWDKDIGGALNPKYKSRGTISYVKFGGDLIVEKSLLTGGKRLRDGKMGGFARVEGVAEGGFYQYKFVCKIK